jgi:malonyl CoA-acyl carrier protein transacylase
MKPAEPVRPVEVAVVGIGIHGLGLDGADAFIHRLFRKQIALRLQDRDLDPSLLAMAAADEAYACGGAWVPARSGLFLALGRSPGVGLELMPRVLQHRFGFLGRGGACLGDQLGGNRALGAAIRRIQGGVLDGALVGAMQVWPEHAGKAPAQDGLAVFLALRRKDGAERSGDRIWAVLGAGPDRDRRSLRFDLGEWLPGPGSTVAGLLQVAAGCAQVDHHVWYSPEEGCWQPFLDRTDGVGFALEVDTPGGAKTRVDLWRPFRSGPAPRPLVQPPGISAYAGATLEDLIRRVVMDEPGGDGPVRLAVVAETERERQGVLERIPLILQRDARASGWLDSGACFSPAPVQGKVACLFTSGGTGYLGMGRNLLLGMPSLPMLIRPLQDLAPADWAYGAHRGRSGDPLYEGAGTMVLSQIHAAFTRDVLGLQPDLAMGLSQGEMNALFAYGAWGGRDGEFELWKRGGRYARLLSGTAEAARLHWGLPEGTEVQWRNWTVFGPVGKVLERVAGEPRAYVSIVFSPVHCMLAGEAQACKRVLAGCPGLTAFLSVGAAEHTPVMAQVRADWYRQHHRPTHAVPGVAFYSNHFGGSYALSDDRVATALTGQAMDPLDFPTAAWRAWDSGVRVFIEHGPRNLLTAALNRLLPRNEGVFLSLDVQGENSLTRAVKVAAELWARGVPVDLGRMRAALERSRAPQAPMNPLLDVAASLFAASLARTGTLDGAYHACLRETQGRFLEFLGLPPDEDL